VLEVYLKASIFLAYKEREGRYYRTGPTSHRHRYPGGKLHRSTGRDRR